MSKFFYPDGKPMDRDTFVSYYNECYYLDNKKLPKASQSSQCTEDEIDRLLKDGIKTKTDVVHILAWKMGKIKHKASKETGKFQYAKDWVRAEEFYVTRYGKPFELGKIAEYIVHHIQNLERKAEEDPQGVLNELRNQQFDGLGSVYLITLLYFISRGKYPIYDRFARMALCAICHGKKPGEIIPYQELPDKTSSKFSGIMEGDMKKYIDQLKDVFGKDLFKDSRKTNRDIDRALWVYGHLFKKTKANSQ